MTFNSKLILVEGLPSTGKSTNSQILRSQLERNGHQVRWIHEVARPHPTLFFDEACLTQKEFMHFLVKYPEIAELLDLVTVRRKRTVGIDLLDLEWNYMEAIGEEAFRELKAYDVWNLPLDRYLEVALEKWECFVEKQKESKEVIILDSAIFQFQIYTFLLENAPYEKLLAFVERLFQLIEGLNPVLIYLHRASVEDTIDFLLEDRGIAFFEHIYQRDQHLPYYVGRPQGAEGYKAFLRDYDQTARKLYEGTPFSKISIDMTERQWSQYTEELLSKLELSFISLPEGVEPPSGEFFNQQLGQYIEITGKTFVTPQGHRKHLIPRHQNEFYLQDLPMTIRVENDKVTIAGEQILERWTTSGTIFSRVE